MERFNYVESTTVTSNTDHSDIQNAGYERLLMLIDVTAVDTTDADETYNFVIQGKDPISGTYYDILDSGDVAGDGATLHVLQVAPELTEAANEKVSDIVPNEFRLQVQTGGTSPSVTYTVSVQLS